MRRDLILHVAAPETKQTRWTRGHAERCERNGETPIATPKQTQMVTADGRQAQRHRGAAVLQKTRCASKQDTSERRQALSSPETPRCVGASCAVNPSSTSVSDR
jgi:hypothetical protein